MGRVFIRSSTVILTGAIAGTFLNYIFNVSMGRLTSPAEYGGIVALLALVAILISPAKVFTTLTTKYIASLFAKKEEENIYHAYRQIVRYSTGVVLIYVIVLLILVPAIQSLIALDTTSILLAIGVVGAVIASSVNRGMLEGLQMFGASMAMSVITAGGKLVLGVLLVMYQWSITGVAFAFFVSVCMSYVFGASVIARRLRHAHGRVRTRSSWRIPRSVYLTAWATAWMSVLTHLDIIVVRYLFDPIQAGNYSALTVAGRIILYGSLFFIPVFFSMTIHAQHKEQKHTLFAISLGVILLVSLPILALFFLAPSTIVTLLFGDKYAVIVPYVGLFGLVSLAWSISTLFIYHFLAANRYVFLYPLVATLAMQTVFIAQSDRTIESVVTILLGTSTTVCLSLIALYITDRMQE